MKANQNKCLGGQATALGALIVVQDCNGSANQAFTAVPDTTPGVFTFKSAANPNLCMEVPGASSSDGARLDLYTCAGIPNQKFMLQ
jgi:endo-1,4-beta-xylanase